MKTSHLVAEMESEGVLAYFHRRKEMENYLLCPSVLGRAAARLVRKRGAKQDTDMESKVGATLETITEPLRAECSGQYVAAFCRFHARSGRDQGTLASEATAVFDQKWACLETRLEIVPGKQVLKELRQMMQDEFQITMTDFQILDSFKEDDVPNDLADLIRKLDAFRAKGETLAVSLSLTGSDQSCRPTTLPASGPVFRSGTALRKFANGGRWRDDWETIVLAIAFPLGIISIILHTAIAFRPPRAPSRSQHGPSTPACTPVVVWAAACVPLYPGVPP